MRTVLAITEFAIEKVEKKITPMARASSKDSVLVRFVGTSCSWLSFSIN